MTAAPNDASAPGMADPHNGGWKTAAKAGGPQHSVKPARARCRKLNRGRDDMLQRAFARPGPEASEPGPERPGPLPAPARPQVLRPEEPGFAQAFGALLTRLRLGDPAALARARRAAEATGERFDGVLAKLGLIAEEDLAVAYAAHAGLPIVAADALPQRPVDIGAVDPAFLRSHRMLPLHRSGEALGLAVVDPFLDEPVAALRYKLGLRIDRALVTPGDFEAAHAALYGGGGDARPAAEAGVALDANDLDVERLRDIANEAPIVRLVNQLVTRAAERRASDIHVEPGRDAVAVRYRIDGVLQPEMSVETQLRAALTTRIKIMAKLDIAERRLPQDGRIRTVVRGVEIDIRVSTLPTAFGESIVMRLLDRIGLAPAIHAGLRRLLQRPNGVVLVTGPTGSGKTTTLYAALNQIDRPGLKVFTVEDPIEYQIPGVSQVQVQPQIGLDFPRALRSILRQDPDIVMVGEIRDLDTARIAIQAALTGHLVLSTLHTNDAVSAVTRLVDIGVEPYLLGATVAGVMAQRLVRRLCPACARPHAAAERVAAELGAPRVLGRAIDPAAIREAVGCEACRGTGYAGRLVVAELLELDDDLRAGLVRDPEGRVLAGLAADKGHRGLFADGADKVAAGQTTLDEVLRVAAAP